MATARNGHLQVVGFSSLKDFDMELEYEHAVRIWRNDVGKHLKVIGAAPSSSRLRRSDAHIC